MISVNKVSHIYNKGSEEELKAVDKVSLQIEQGEFIVILGHNGSGKSTLAKMFNALILPSEGSVLIDGMNTSDENAVYSIRNLVGMVFQNPDSQLVATTVEDELAFGPENIGVPRDEIIERINHALKVTSMERFRTFAPHRLSGGQKQKIAIASVLAMRPKYLILDEPTSMLDPKGQKDIIETLKELNKKEGISVILVTQHMHEAFYADRILVMKSSALSYNGSPYDLFSNDTTLKQLNLSVPIMGLLAKKLRSKGLKISSKAFVSDVMAEELIRIGMVNKNHRL